MRRRLYGWIWRLRALNPRLTDDERDNVRCGIRREFRLPYPEPRNEHEDGMNMVAVMAEKGVPVVSGRADW